MTLRVVVVDELPFLCDGIAAALSSDPTCRIVDRGSSSTDAVRLVEDGRTDQLVLGVSNIEESLATITGVLAKAPRIRIVCLAPSGTESAIHRLLQAGARGCISKRAEGSELMRCIEMVRHDKHYVSPNLAIDLLKVLAPRPPVLKPEPTPEPGILTARELEILQLVSIGESNKTIAQKLSASEKSIKRGMTSIMQKIHVRNRLQAAVYLEEHVAKKRSLHAL